MPNPIQVLLDAYNNDVMSDEFMEAIDELKDEPDANVLPLISKILSENKSEGISSEVIGLLRYYKNFLDDSAYKESTENIRKIILDVKNSDSLRLDGINALSYLSEWPDLTLREVIQSDGSRELKNFAFRSVLTQLKLPRQVIELETSLAIQGEIEPSFARIEQVTQARADGHFDHLQS
jgi:hypothetical protein